MKKREISEFNQTGWRRYLILRAATFLSSLLLPIDGSNVIFIAYSWERKRDVTRDPRPPLSELNLLELNDMKKKIKEREKEREYVCVWECVCKCARAYMWMTQLGREISRWHIQRRASINDERCKSPGTTIGKRDTPIAASARVRRDRHVWTKVIPKRATQPQETQEKEK